jgi:UDP-N-acetylglucosamine 1-carboxyvinyltransferase
VRRAVFASLVDRVGRRIAELHVDRGLTQAQLAEVLDVALTNLQRIEHGKQNLTLISLERVADALGVDARALLDPPSTVRPGPGRPSRGGGSAAPDSESGRPPLRRKSGALKGKGGTGRLR